MALFPEKTPDEIVFGVFFILAGIFFYRIFELSPLLNYLPKISLVAGALFLGYGIFRLISIKKENKE